MSARYADWARAQVLTTNRCRTVALVLLTDYADDETRQCALSLHQFGDELNQTWRAAETNLAILAEAGVIDRQPLPGHTDDDGHPLELVTVFWDDFWIPDEAFPVHPTGWSAEFAWTPERQHAAEELARLEGIPAPVSPNLPALAYA